MHCSFFCSLVCPGLYQVSFCQLCLLWWEAVCENFIPKYQSCQHRLWKTGWVVARRKLQNPPEKSFLEAVLKLWAFLSYAWKVDNSSPYSVGTKCPILKKIWPSLAWEYFILVKALLPAESTWVFILTFLNPSWVPLCEISSYFEIKHKSHNYNI